MLIISPKKLTIAVSGRYTHIHTLYIYIAYPKVRQEKLDIEFIDLYTVLAAYVL